MIKKLAVQKESAFKGSFKTRLKIKLPFGRRETPSSCSHAPWVGWADIHAFFHKSVGQKRSACPPIPTGTPLSWQITLSPAQVVFTWYHSVRLSSELINGCTVLRDMS